MEGGVVGVRCDPNLKGSPSKGDCKLQLEAACPWRKGECAHLLLDDHSRVIPWHPSRPQGRVGAPHQQRCPMAGVRSLIEQKAMRLWVWALQKVTEALRKCFLEQSSGQGSLGQVRSRGSQWFKKCI